MNFSLKFVQLYIFLVSESKSKQKGVTTPLKRSEICMVIYIPNFRTKEQTKRGDNSIEEIRNLYGYIYS